MNTRRWLVVAALAACVASLALTGPAASAAPQAVNGLFRVQT